MSQVAIRPKLTCISSSIKRLRVFLLPSPLSGILVHGRVTHGIKFADTHLCAWVEKGTVRVKCLTQEHNMMTPMRAQNPDRSIRSQVH